MCCCVLRIDTPQWELWMMWHWHPHSSELSCFNHNNNNNNTVHWACMNCCLAYSSQNFSSIYWQLVEMLCKSILKWYLNSILWCVKLQSNALWCQHRSFFPIPSYIWPLWIHKKGHGISDVSFAIKRVLDLGI